MKKLIPALVLLLVSAMVLSTSSYAWFSMNKTVSATGMSLTSTAPANLLITNKAGKDGDGNFADGVWASSINASEVYLGKLFPSSTATAQETEVGSPFFFAVTEGQTIGSTNIGGVAETAGENATRFLTTGVVKLIDHDTATPVNNGYWAEYTLYFKTTGDSKLDVYLSAVAITNSGEVKYVSVGSRTTEQNVAGLYTKSGETYTLVTTGNGDGTTEYYTTIDDSVRVALFTVSAGVETLVGVYDLGAENDTVTPISAVTSGTAGDFATGTEFEELVDRDITDNTKYADTNTFEVKGNELVTELLVRVWIEGQNPKCINAVAGDSFGLAFTFNIKEST